MKEHIPNTQQCIQLKMFDTNWTERLKSMLRFNELYITRSRKSHNLETSQMAFQLSKLICHHLNF